MDEAEILTWYEKRLPKLGWSRDRDARSRSNTQEWLRLRADGRYERLRLATGRADRRPSFASLLLPTPSQLSHPTEATRSFGKPTRQAHNCLRELQLMDR